MDSLRMMEIVWPSAGRALELLQGAKVNLEESDLVALSSHPDRHKRSAEQPLNDAFDRSHPSNDGMTQDYLELRPPNYNSHYNNHSAYQTTGLEVPASAAGDLQAPYVSSYDRWPSENLNTYSFSGPLSTSVLPQLYSTGLVDERGSSSSQRVHPNPDQGRTNNAGRYPQFWNDYSTYSQLGTAYGTYPEQTPIPPQQPAQTQMYMPESYNLYS